MSGRRRAGESPDTHVVGSERDAPTERPRDADPGSPIARGLRITRPDGIRFGKSDFILLRELVLFEIDLTRTDWYRGQVPLRAVDKGGGVRMRWLSHDEWRSAPDMLDTAPELAAERYRAGDRCLIGWDAASGMLAYHLWVSAKGAYIPWIFKFVPTPPGRLLLFDLWVHPVHRGGSVHWAAASEVCHEARRQGRPGFVAGVEEHEYFAHASKYARLGLGLAVPYGSIVGVKLWGAKVHLRRAPSSHLVAFSRQLAAQYPAVDRDSGGPPSSG